MRSRGLFPVEINSLTDEAIEELTKRVEEELQKSSEKDGSEFIEMELKPRAQGGRFGEEEALNLADAPAELQGRYCIKKTEHRRHKCLCPTFPCSSALQ